MHVNRHSTVFFVIKKWKKGFSLIRQHDPTVNFRSGNASIAQAADRNAARPVTCVLHTRSINKI